MIYVGSTGFQSVRRAAAVSRAGIGPSPCGGLNAWPPTVNSAEREARRRAKRSNRALADPPSTVTARSAGLTPRSSGAPTAGHQGPVRGTVYIFSARALASCRRRPLSSNVRPRESSSLRFSIRLGLEASPRFAPVSFCASLRLRLCGSFLCSPTLCPLPRPTAMYRLVLHRRPRKSRGLLA